MRALEMECSRASHEESVDGYAFALSRRRAACDRRSAVCLRVPSKSRHVRTTTAHVLDEAVEVCEGTTIFVGARAADAGASRAAWGAWAMLQGRRVEPASATGAWAPEDWSTR
jgi:hypothetical protein